MKRSHDPLRLDVAAFAADAAELSGEWPGQALQRLAQAQSPPQDLGLQPVAWQAQGEWRTNEGRPDGIWLHLKAACGAWLTCQRCLQPLQQALSVDSAFRFVRGEAEAAALDAEAEEDVLALSRSLDLRELVEDELLLALPIVPRHDICPQPLPLSASDPVVEDSAGQPNPFAALKGLKVTKPPG